MHSNKYTFMYAIGLSVLTAIILVFTSEKLKPRQEENVALDTKKNILQSVRITETDRKTIESVYGKSVQELVVNAAGDIIDGVDAKSIVMKNEVRKDTKDRQLPLYIYTGDDGQKRYIVPLYGVGLWGPIWGYISLDSDFNTIYGAYFDHKSETPGLGAEISEQPFQERFEGKKIMEDGNFVSVHVVKATAKTDYGPDHRVDAISGGTITSNGVDEMIKNCVAPYMTYFNELKVKKE